MDAALNCNVVSDEPTKIFDFVTIAFAKYPDNGKLIPIGKDVIRSGGRWATVDGNAAFSYCSVSTIPIATESDVLPAIVRAGQTPDHYISMGKLGRKFDPTEAPRNGDAFQQFPHWYVPFDLDGFDCDSDDPETVAEAGRAILPAACHGVSAAYNITAGHRFTDGKARCRLFLPTNRPVTSAQTLAWLESEKAAGALHPCVDLTLYQPERIIFTAPRRIVGGPDPIPVRWGTIPGSLRMIVPLPAALSAAVAESSADTTAPAAPKNKNLPADPNARMNDPAYIRARLAREFVGRATRDDPSRGVAINLVAQRFNESAFDDKIKVAAISTWLHRTDAAEHLLARYLVSVGCEDGAKIARDVRAAGEADGHLLDARARQHGPISVKDIQKRIKAVNRKPDNGWGSVRLEAYLETLEKAQEARAVAASTPLTAVDEDEGEHPGGEHLERVKVLMRDNGWTFGYALERAEDEANERAAAIEAFDEADFFDAANDNIEAKPESKTKAPKFALLTIEEAIAHSRKNHTPYLVKNLLNEGGSSVLFAPSNVGKTFVQIDIGFHVAAGLEWCGHRVRQGAVLYIAAEGGAVTFNRLDALSRRHKVEGVPFYITTAAPDLAHETKDRDAIVKLVREHEAKHGIKFKLLVIDTLAMALNGADENSNEGMGALIGAVNHIRLQTGAHVSLVHHAGKDTAKGARGHSSLRAAVDCELEIKEGVLKVTKLRDAPSGAEYPFHLESIALGKDADGDDYFSCVVNWTSERRKDLEAPTPAEAAYLDAIGEVQKSTGRASVTHDDIVAALNKARGAAGETPAVRSNINRLREGLRKKGYLNADDFGVVHMLPKPNDFAFEGAEPELEGAA